MTIEWVYEEKSAVIFFNEAYFKFPYTVLFRVDCNDENNLKMLTKEQKVFFDYIIRLQGKDRPILKRITFTRNELHIELLEEWDNSSVQSVNDMIAQSWPTPRLNLKAKYR